MTDPNNGEYVGVDANQDAVVKNAFDEALQPTLDGDAAPEPWEFDLTITVRNISEPLATGVVRLVENQLPGFTVERS